MREDAEEQSRLAHKRDATLETELRASRERATQLEADKEGAMIELRASREKGCCVSG